MGHMRRGNKIGSGLLVLGVLGTLSCLAGCSPSWHSGDESWSLNYHLNTAEVIGDNLMVTGNISPIVSLTEVGLKIRRVQDNTGRKLAFRSFRTLYAKGLWFVIAFDKPAKSAESVSLDMVFTSRSGLQEVSRRMPIQWDAKPDFRTGGAGAFD